MRSFVCIIISVICLFEIKSISGMILNKDLSFRMYIKNESISLKISTARDVTDLVNGATCQCRIDPLENSLTTSKKEDYLYTPNIGSHKLHLNAKTWNEARKICNEEDGHLAIINSKAEETVLLEMLNNNSAKIRGAANKKQAFLGIHDMFKEDEWVTIFGESIFTTGYAEWSTVFYSGQPDNLAGNQNCGTLITIGGLDDVFCEDKFAFFCEIPLTCS